MTEKIDLLKISGIFDFLDMQSFSYKTTEYESGSESENEENIVKSYPGLKTPDIKSRMNRLKPNIQASPIIDIDQNSKKFHLSIKNLKRKIF